MPIPESVQPVRVGIAGLGRAGMFHVERIGLRDDFKVVAVFDDCRAARDRASFESASLYGTWKEFLSDERIEVVLVATPPATHAELAIAAIAAGKHVVVETPLALSVVEVDAIIAAARRTGRSVSVAQTRRWDDDFCTARGIMQAGGIGRPSAIRFVSWQYNPRLNNGKTPGQTSQTGSGESDDIADHWRTHPATGGGVLWESGVHQFDQLLQLAGQPVTSVFGRLWAGGSTGIAENAFLAIVCFADGLTAQIEINRAAAAPHSTGWMIAGDAGSYGGFTHYQPTADGEIVDLPLTPCAAPADEFYRQLARHLRHGEPNPVPAGEVRATIALIEAVRNSANRGEAVHIST
jgi:predicted dehydrogenase